MDTAYLQLELDVYWAEFAGVSAPSYLKKYADRCKLVHLKDMADAAEREFTELGNGVIDFDMIIIPVRKSAYGGRLLNRIFAENHRLRAPKSA